MARRRRSPLLGGWMPDAVVPVEPATALARSGLALYSWYLGTDEIAWSPNAAEVLGAASLDRIASGEALRAIIEPGGGTGPFEAALAGSEAGAENAAPYRARYALRTRFNRFVAVEDLGRCYTDDQGRPALLRGLIRAEPTGIDELSINLKARGALLAEIFDDVLQAQGSRRAVTLVVGQLGCEDGDLNAAEVEERIRGLLRRRDRFLCYAPDRFALVLSSCPVNEAALALRRLSDLIGDDRVKLGGASAPDHALDAPQLLRRAEEAMESGLGPVSLYRPAEPRLNHEIGTSPDRILALLNERRLGAAFHSAPDGHGGKPVFATLVPRLHGPAGPTPLPDPHEAAARAGLTTLVDTRLVELAAARLARHSQDTVALCVSTASLKSREWLEGLSAHLGARPGIQSRLIIAVHEAGLLDPATQGRLDAVKALGVGLMLIGFGTGHASIRHLQTLPLDILRLDQSLVEALPRLQGAREVVRNLVAAAQHCGIATLAEADETLAPLLVEWGVDYVERPSIAGAPGLEPKPVQRSVRSAAA